MEHFEKHDDAATEIESPLDVHNPEPTHAHPDTARTAALEHLSDEALKGAGIDPATRERAPE